MGITGNLTLDAGGDPNGVFIFQVASILMTATDSQVILSGGANAANIFWQVGTSAVLGTRTKFKGTIMADQSISFATGATLNGRALARIGAVTLDASAITLAASGVLPPQFGPIQRNSNESVTLVITNTPGLTLTLQQSTDLLDWKPLAKPTPSISPVTYLDATASGDAKRFYRAFYP